MAFAVRETVEVTTDGSGNATFYTGVVNGPVQAVAYIKDDFTNGLTMTLSTEVSAQTIWTEAAVNASTTRAPRHSSHDTAGAAATYDATRLVLVPIWAVNERIKIVISAGGAAKSGTYHIIVGG